MFEDFFRLMEKVKIIPVIVLNDSRKAGPLAEALIKGGIPVAEITFRTDAAADAIKKMSALSRITVGAGTVRTVEQAEAAIKSGAEFIVSPGLNTSVVEWAVNKGIPIVPGVDSTLGIETALAYSLKVLKFFPASASGGIKKLKSLYGPYRDVKFVPTGGINGENLKDWLSLPSVLACGGSWVVPADLIENKEWDKITALSLKARELADSGAYL